MDEEEIREVFDGLGPVSIRRMFGGQGIYHQGLIVGLVLSTGELMIKGDEVSGPEIEAAGGTRWVYEMRGRSGAMPYWTIPDAARDDPEELAVWTRRGEKVSVTAQAFIEAVTAR